MNPATPGQHIRAMRGSRSRHSVARAAGIDPAQLQRVEEGAVGLSVESLYRLLLVIDEVAARVLAPYVRDRDVDDDD